MDIVGSEVKSDDVTYFSTVDRVNHPCEMLGLDHDLVMYAHEDNRLDPADQLSLFVRNDLEVFGSDNNINGLVGSKSAVEAIEGAAAEAYEAVLMHDAVDDVALADKVGNKGILGLVINIFGCADLLDLALVHDDDGIAHCEGLFLIVGYIYERDADLLLDSLEFVLHLLAELEVEGAQRLVEKKDAGMVYQRTCDGNTLLLAAGEGSDLALGIIGQADQLKHTHYAVFDLGLGHLADAEAECNVVKNVHVGEKGIALEDRIYLALIGGQVVDLFSIKIDHTGAGRFKAANNAQSSGLAAAGRTKQCYEFLVPYVQIYIVKNYFATVILMDIFQVDKLFGHILPSYNNNRTTIQKNAYNVNSFRQKTAKIQT